MSVGSLEVIVGPMFAGKTEELIRRLGRAEIAQRRVVAIKPAFDQRYDADRVVSHSGRSIPSVVVSSASDAFRAAVTIDAQVVGIEEIQFFEVGIIDAIEELVQEGRHVICAGLDVDIFARPFGVTPTLMALADHVDKLSAVCMRCGADATRSQLLGIAEPETSGVHVELGGSERYEARCRNCFVLPDAEHSTLPATDEEGHHTELFLPGTDHHQLEAAASDDGIVS